MSFIVTLKDIAKKAEVSTCTVSRYLNANIKIKKETELKIESAIDELGYVPNVVAKSLKQKKTTNIAVILPKLNHLFYSEVTSGISKVLQEKDYNLFIYELDNFILNEDEILQLMRENMVAGIIFIGLFADDSFETKIKDLHKWKIPFIFANRHIEDESYPLIYPDLVKASEISVSHLLDTDKSNIAFVHKALPEKIKQLFRAGYDNVSNHDQTPLFIEVEDGESSIKSCVEDIKMHNINGVFVLNQLHAIQLTKQLIKEGYDMQQDIGLISLGNSLLTELSSPELTSVDLRNKELGERCAEAILHQIDRKKGKQDPIMIDPFLVRREST